MSTEASAPNAKGGIRKRPALRPAFLALILVLASTLGFLIWPSNVGLSAIDLSNEDGKPRFVATTESDIRIPEISTIQQRLMRIWMKWQRRYKKRNPARVTFPGTSAQLHSVQGGLDQCMDLTGTQYLIAVELAGSTVEFNHTNNLSGAQFVLAFEKALSASAPVLCYDFANKRGYYDSPLVIREGRNTVKVVPRSKLADYQKAGLVKSTIH